VCFKRVSYLLTYLLIVTMPILFIVCSLFYQSSFLAAIIAINVCLVFVFCLIYGTVK